MAELRYPADLTTGDMKPSHVTARIQSIGYLLSFSSDWVINHASLNCGELFGRDARSLIGTPAAACLSEDTLHDIRSSLQMVGQSDAIERLFGIDLCENGRLFDLSVHSSGRSYILECEPSETGRRRDYVSYVRPIIDRMRKASSVQELCDSAARQLRGLTGFDRVMIYRFGHGGAGEVIAESLNGQVPSYRGLHFPASDIPAEARRHCARNNLRIIIDVDDPTIEIIPDADHDDEPLDLSMSGLCAASPIHVESLRNMGVKASMSVSIMRRGELWGLIAGHHYGPMNLPYSVRAAAELFGDYFAFILDQVETDAALQREQNATRLHDEIMARVAGGHSLLDAFEEFADSIGRVIPFDGIAGWVNDEFVSRGLTPDEAQFAQLAQFLNTAGAGGVWASDKLEGDYSNAADFADKAAGMLALPVSRSPGDYIALFRKEHVRQVNWAGDPRKLVEPGADDAPLTARKSFDLWKEERRGHSKPWTRDEISCAESLRGTLLEVVLRLADAANAVRVEASKRQDVLIAELNHRVRNILNLIRGLVTQSKQGSETIEQFVEIVGRRIYALARAHDQVTQTDWSPSSLHGLIRTEGEAYAAGSMARILIEGPDAMIAPRAFTTLALVVHEMLTNSAKYGALSDRGTVSIAIGRNEDDALVIEWHESDGPPVRPPTRRGFGSTIIERTIPHELGGIAEIEYPEEGVRARFELPAEHIAAYDTVPPSLSSKEPNIEGARKASPEVFRGTALIVEDNVIIAMEAEDILRSMGFEDCSIAGSVAAAQDVIEDGRVSFAMLDVNLGKETSDAIAQRLAGERTPFIFASGYGDSSIRPEQFAGVPIITKPYSENDIKSAIGKLQLGT